MLFDNTFTDFFNIANNIPAFSMSSKVPAYPHFNITEIDKEGRYKIDVALAGCKKEDINVQFEPYHKNPHAGLKVLKIEAHYDHYDDEGAPKFLHKGIAYRDAKLSLLTHKENVVENCSYENGILSIIILKPTREDEDVEKIDIG